MAVFVSQGELTAVDQTMPQLVPFSPARVGLYGGNTADYVTIYRTQPALRIVVDFLARNIADIGVHAYQRTGGDSRKRLRAEDHPLAAFLDQPNPYLTQYELLWWTVVDKAVFDMAFWAKVNFGGDQAVQPIPPNFMRPMGTNFLWPSGFKLVGNRGYRDFRTDQIVYFRGYDPQDPRIGVSAIETLRRELAEDDSMGAYRENFWRNGAQATGVLTRPVDAPEWASTEKRRFRADWQSRFGPAGSEAGGTPILEDGMDYKTISFDAQQSQYIETRKLTREEAASAYGVAPTLVGILDHATFSNISAQHIQAYQDTLGPWFTALEQRINKDLVPEFPDTAGVYVEFNVDKKLRGSFEEQARAYAQAGGGPWMVRDEIRARQNLPALGGAAAELITPMNVTVGGQANPLDTAPPPKTTDFRPFLEAKRRGIAARMANALRRGVAPHIDELVPIELWETELADLSEAGGSQ